MVLGIALEIPTQKNGVGDFSQRHFWRWADIFGVGHTFFFWCWNTKNGVATPFFFSSTPKNTVYRKWCAQRHFFSQHHFWCSNAIFVNGQFFGLILDTTPRRIEIFQFGSNHLKALVFFYDVLDFGFDTIIFRGFKNQFKKLIQVISK